ncbi:non-ribosomal peptide synthetase [Rhizobium sp. FY34]|uniref:non-ribosomal peptide synthetase n=1 Tax=Rhizobium sp. FY34 TaxID=2562309 RepID=UPI0010C120DF|nr:non-ribosomal peptide synthetase [Rhizobium sp. FY34]
MDISRLSPDEKRQLLQRLMAAQQTSERTKFRLSHAQERIWFVEQMQPGAGAYSIPLAIRLNGPLDRDRLKTCFDIVVQRHESLRTVFEVVDGEPFQVIASRSTSDFSFHELAGDELPRDAAVSRFAREPFELSQGPLFRVGLFSIAPDEHILVMVIHHIISDYASLQILIDEVYRLYSASESPSVGQLPALAIQYRDYAEWQRNGTAALSGQVDYWREQLRDAPLLLQLPFDFARPVTQAFRGARHTFHLGPELSAAIKDLAKSRQLTTFMVLLASYQILLARLSRSDDICIGTTASNRNRAETRNLIGLFVNNLVMRTRLQANDSFDALLARVRDTALEALSNQDVPFEQVVDALNVERDMGHNALFQSTFVLHNAPGAAFDLGDIKVTPIALDSGASRFDLSLDMHDGRGIEGFSGVFEFNTELFLPETVRRFSDYFLRLLRGLLSNPGGRIAEIDLLNETEHAAMAAANQTSAAFPLRDVASLLEETAQARSSFAAVRCGTRQYSHGDLNDAANRVASGLRDRIGHGASHPRIAICLPRSENLVIAILAVLKLGGHYVPLDPGHPAERRALILEDCRPDIILVSEADDEAANSAYPCDYAAIEPLLLATGSFSNPHRKTSPDDLAYIIYTSGSTGRPKGVPIRQKSLVNLLTSMARRPGMSADDRFLAVTTPAFDIATLELLMPLLVGGLLIIAEADDVYDDMALSELIRKHGATMMQATPATWRLMADADWKAPAAFKMLCGGEALEPGLARRLLAAGGELWNLYGPTETTIWSTCTRIDPEHLELSALPIGEPIANTQLHLLDDALMPVPAGVVGDLYIGGEGLSPGYFNREDLTARAFVEGPAAGSNGRPETSRLYRTGDLMRRTAAGHLLYVGRADFQVKLRGFRIELSEIEAILAAQPSIEQAVVALWQDEEGSGTLVAYCRSGTGPADEDAIRAALALQLPSYMLPAAYVWMDNFPLNANGKIDRKRLERPTQIVSSAAYAAPREGTEQIVAAIWRELLRAEKVGRDDNFFTVGGHSLLATRMLARLRRSFAVELPLRSIFEKPRLAEFASAIDALLPMTGRRPQADASGLARRDHAGRAPLSHAQNRQWALAQLEPDSPLYNIPFALKIRGPLDLEILSHALKLTAQRQDILRSRFVSIDGRPFIETDPEMIFPIVPEEIGDADLEAALLDCARRPFDLAVAPLFRIHAFRTGPQDHVLLFILHHIIGDALSAEILLNEVAEFYASLSKKTEPSHTVLPLQYADFAVWQQEQDTKDQVDYWCRTLAGAPPLLELPTDFVRPAIQGFAGDSIRFSLNAVLLARLRKLCDQQGATLFMGMLAAFSTLLQRVSGMRDIVIGTPVSERFHPDLENLIGMFVNTLAIRLQTQGGETFNEALKVTRDTTLGAFANQAAPFEKVVDTLSLPRTWSHNPLFQAMLVSTVETRRRPISLADMDWERLLLPDTSSRVDLTLFIHETAEELSCRLEYRSDLFRRATIESLGDALVALIENIVERPNVPLDRLSLLSGSQQKRLRHWNETDTAFRPRRRCLHDFVKASAEANPQATAVTDQDGSLSYAELDRKADRLASGLAAAGIGRGKRVGIRLERRVGLVVAILAVLRTGAAYVPLDPRYPADRIEFIAADADLALILVTTEDDISTVGQNFRCMTPGMVDNLANGVVPAQVASGSDLAYIIYTSGSTGRPKGVAIEHRNAVAFVQWCLHSFTGDQLSGVLASTSICFDLSIFEIFATLAAGGRIFLVDDLFALPNAPFVNDVTLVNTVPTPMSELLKLGPLPQSVKTVCLAGEPLPRELVARIYANDRVENLYNLYGPSEDTTYSTVAPVPKSGEWFGIGVPIANTRTYVLDGEMNEVPVGVPGELFLSGSGLARGYWNRPGQTAERFLPNPFADCSEHRVMYQTGDIVRRRDDGGLDYMGRGDRQLKLNGFRIEPGEIEAVLLQQEGVHEAVVGLWRDASSHPRLAMWIAGDHTVEIAKLVTTLRQRLPEHFIPVLATKLEALPRLPNGKLDRSALPDPSAHGERSRETARPINDQEKALAQLWQALLGCGDIRRNDNFFSLGGDSILAIQLVSQARQKGLKMTPRDVFLHPTLASLAEATQAGGALTAATGHVDDESTLSAIQHWLLDQDLPDLAHWNQGLILKPTRSLDPDRLEKAISRLLDEHQSLRARFLRENGQWHQEFLPISAMPPMQRLAAADENDVTEFAKELHAGFDLGAGPLFGAILATLPDGSGRLILAAHHLIVDGVSWRVIVADIQRHYLENSSVRSGAVASDKWNSRLSRSELFDAEEDYWRSICEEDVRALPLDNEKGGNRQSDAVTYRQTIDAETTRQLLRDVPECFSIASYEVLVAALYLTLRQWSSEPRLRIEMESHGRPHLFEDIDVSETVGWHTALYPVLLDTPEEATPDRLLLDVKDTLRRTPNNGVGFGVLKYLRNKGEHLDYGKPQVRFNYLGQIDAMFGADGLFAPSGITSGPMYGPGNPRDAILEINAMVVRGELQLQWIYGAQLHFEHTITTLTGHLRENLQTLIQHCLKGSGTGFSPSDFPLMNLGQDELDNLLKSL